MHSINVQFHWQWNDLSIKSIDDQCDLYYDKLEERVIWKKNWEKYQLNLPILIESLSN